MSFKAAVDALCDLTVTGVTVHDMAVMPPGVLVPLPCLIAVVNFSPQGLQFFTTDESGKLTCEVEHWLLTAGLNRGLPGGRMYDTLTHVDNYLAALKADWRLNDTLLTPLKVIGVSYGPIDYAGASYIGVKFRHQWEVLID